MGYTETEEFPLNTLTPEPVLTQRNRLGIPTRAALFLSAALSLVFAAGSIPDSITLTARNTIIASLIADRQTDQVEGFFKEYVAFVKLEDVLVIPNQVNMDPFQASVFSQESLISLKKEPSSKPISTFSSYYNANGALLSHEIVVTDRTSVNLPEINSDIDDVIAEEGPDSPKLANLYEELLRKSFNLPPETDCFSSTLSMGTQGRLMLSVSCWQRYNGWDFAAFMRTDGSILGEISDPEGWGSCGLPLK